MDMNIDELRQEIDRVDDNIAALFAKRMELARRIAQQKSANGVPIVNVGREKEIVSRVCATLPSDVKLYGKQLFDTLFDTSKAYQYAVTDIPSPIKDEIRAALAEGEKPFPVEATVACQGVPGAYSCIAAEKMFAISSISCFKNWDGVFQAVEKGFCDFGVLPIENSTAGSVIGVYDLMRKHRFFVVRSVKLKVKHYLLARSDAKIDNIKEVISHDQAIMQCSAAIKALNGVKITRCDNTALAAKIVAESGRDDFACIASRECAGIYGLKILKEGVNDSHNNFTRFIAISNKLRTYENANRISVTVNLSHEAGSLNKLLNKFSTLGLNLTKLESRPIPDSPFEFCFYFDFEAKASSKEVQNLLAEIAGETDNFEFLGAYEEM